MRRRVVKAVVIVGMPLIAACSLLFQLDGPGAGPADAAPPLDAGDAANDVADATPPPGCPLVHWPARPAADDPGGADVDLTFALQTVELGFGDAGPAPGFDLDGLCTCPDAPACAGTGLMCDRDGGVDNGGGDLLTSLSGFGKVIDQARANEIIAIGHASLLFVLHKYNGTQNDPQVELALFISDGTPVNDAGFHPPARFDGTDVWTLNRSSVAGQQGPPFLPVYVDPVAYVARGVLVAHVDFPLTVSGAFNLTVKLQGGVLAARVTSDGGLGRLGEGVIAGRWATVDALAALAEFDDPFVDGGKLCKGSLTYAAIKPRICGAPDITADAAGDRTGAACDAFSMGVGFTAVQALAGPLGPVVDASSPCGPNYKDECSN